MKNTNDYINILKSYQNMIERDNGQHPTAVLSDISASLKFVLAGTEAPTMEKQPENSPMSVDVQYMYIDKICRANAGQRALLRCFIDNCEASSMDYEDLDTLFKHTNTTAAKYYYSNLDTACRDKVIDYAKRVFD